MAYSHQRSAGAFVQVLAFEENDCIPNRDACANSMERKFVEGYSVRLLLCVGVDACFRRGVSCNGGFADIPTERRRSASSREVREVRELVSALSRFGNEVESWLGSSAFDASSRSNEASSSWRRLLETDASSSSMCSIVEGTKVVDKGHWQTFLWA